MRFIKDENVFFNRNDLSKAIELHTDNPKDEYKVSIRNGYPCICIGHRHWYVHRLLGEYYFGDISNYFIHHIDGNKRNNSKDNLKAISNSEHTKLHHIGNDFRSNDGIMESVKAMANAKRRDDINPRDVKMQRENGATYKELCQMFKCGNSVISRCLK